MRPSRSIHCTDNLKQMGTALHKSLIAFEAARQRGLDRQIYVAWAIERLWEDRR